jgi:hypothetical protein
LLWAALAYAAGTALSAHIWRPATRWFAVIAIFLASAAFLARGRPRSAQVLALSALMSLAILAAQLRVPAAAPYEFPAEDAAVSVTAHVTAEGEALPTPNGGVRQTLEVETEEVSFEGVSKQLATGLRLNLFVPNTEDATLAGFHYGNRMRFPARLRPPRRSSWRPCIRSTR